LMPIARPARLSLHTERLILAPGDASDAIEIYELMLSNHAYFSFWNPVVERSLLSANYALQLVESERQAWDQGEGLRYWIRLRHAPSSLIGWVKIDALTAGAFHSGRVGYAIAEAHHRRGYMQEALAAVKRWLFAPRVNLHRLQASVLPENLASLRVLRHCDFEDIGLARSYLWVRGAWRDHVITQCINSAWRDG
ncbi:MAG: N-acetyltransferase, partial [Betaproteobacteria bacterium]|nr:N-acetyltransferase [Betaproteobacteria bacterium]